MSRETGIHYDPGGKTPDIKEISRLPKYIYISRLQAEPKWAEYNTSFGKIYCFDAFESTNLIYF